MAEINEQLETAQARGILVAIYNFIDEETFSVGRIMAQDETYVLLEVVDPNGSLNGLQLINKAFIDHVILRSDYLRSTEVWQQAAMAGGYSDPWHLMALEDHMDINDDYLLRSILQQVVNEKMIVNLGTIKQEDEESVVDADFTGFIGEYVGDVVALNYLDPWDLTDAWQLDLKTDEINYLRIGAGVCVRMKALMQTYTDETFPE